MTPTRRIEELDFARAAAMLAVIAIHVTSTFINAKSSYTLLGMNLAFILNQAARFAVPLFILISGVSLRLRSPIDETPAAFYKKRFFKTGGPYLFWFTAYFLYNYPGILTPPFHRGWRGAIIFLRSLLLGRAAPHLYFMIVLFQLYLLYPIARRHVIKSAGTCVLLSFTVTYGIQQLFLLSRSGTELIPAFLRPHLWMLFPTWIFYFVLGISLTYEHILLIRQISQKAAIPILVSTALLGALSVLESNALNWTDSIRAAWNVYTVLVFFSLFAVWPLIGRLRFLPRMIKFLADRSMTVYFGHVFILYFFRSYPLFTTGTAGMLLLYLAVSTASILAASLIDTLHAAILKK